MIDAEVLCLSMNHHLRDRVKCKCNCAGHLMFVLRFVIKWPNVHVRQLSLFSTDVLWASKKAFLLSGFLSNVLKSSSVKNIGY